MTIERLEYLKNIIDCRAPIINKEVNAELLELIRAEIERQSITDQEIKNAINYYGTSITEHEVNNYETDDIDYNRWQDENLKRDKLVIMALRQMKNEPCEWCDGGWHDIVGDFVGFSMENNIITAYGDGQLDIKISYCPFCGRKLGD